MLLTDTVLHITLEERLLYRKERRDQTAVLSRPSIMPSSSSSSPSKPIPFFNPQPHILDIRSLLVFRVLFGLYLCYDVVTRILPLPLSIEWYTSHDPTTVEDDSTTSSQQLSFLAPNDSPHGNVIHKLWFARTSPEIQYMLFGLTFIMSAVFAIGHRLGTSPVGRLSLWLLVVSMQHRCMPVHDGSDNFTRQMLMWYCLLPSEVHNASIVELLQSKKDKKKNLVYEITSYACLGLTLQILLMYMGTIAKRIYDPTLMAIKLNGQTMGQQHVRMASEWTPPELSAVHFVLRDSFAIRNNWVVNWMRRQPFQLTQGMTAHAMMSEISPIVWFLCPNSSIRKWGFFILCTLHFGLLLTTRLPNWQFTAMIASILWIPSCAWKDDAYKDNEYDESGGKKKGEEETNEDQEEEKEKKDTSDGKSVDGSATKKSFGCRVRQFIVFFLLAHMVYNFSAERRWIPKVDGGDIGEFFRISQFWVMYGTIPRTSVTTNIIGYKKVASDIEGEEESVNNKEQWIDILKVLETGNSTAWVSGSSVVYSEDPPIVSPRWERAIHQWSQRQEKRRIRYFLASLCNHFGSTNMGIERLEFITIKYKIVVPPPHAEDGVEVEDVNIPRWEVGSGEIDYHQIAVCDKSVL